MVIQRSEICIKLQLSVLMIAGSYFGFLLAQCRPCVVDMTKSFLKRPQLELYKREAMWGQGGFVSIYVPEGYRYGYRFGTGETLEKKEQFHHQRKHKTN